MKSRSTIDAVNYCFNSVIVQSSICIPFNRNYVKFLLKGFESFPIFFSVKAFFNALFEFGNRYFRNKTIFKASFINFPFKIEFAVEKICTNICV